MKHLLLIRRLLHPNLFLGHLGYEDAPFRAVGSTPVVSCGDSTIGAHLLTAKNPGNEVLLLGLAAGLLLLLTALLFLLVRRIVKLHRQINSSRHHQADQLRFIRKLLDLCYAYKESPLVFLDKFKDNVNFRQLKSYDLIESSDKRLARLKEDERLLCLLFDRGFTPRELCVIFDLKKINNLYVKYHRIRKKIGDE